MTALHPSWIPAIRFTLAGLVSIYLFGCEHSKDSSSAITPMSHRLNPLFAQTKVVCFGRFAIDVPATATVVFGPAEAEASIKFFPDEASRVGQRVADQLKQVEREREYLTETDKIKLPMYGKVIDGAAPGQKLIFGSENQVGYSIYSFIPIGSHLFIHEIDGVLHKEGRVEAVTNLLNRVATNLLLRDENEIPAENGACIEGGFIPLDMRYEKVTLGVRLSEFPDVNFSILAHRRPNHLQEFSDLETLLDRAEQNAKRYGFAAEYARIKTFRRGPRELGQWKGFEILARKPPFKKDTDAHEFRFRSLGAVDDTYRPELDVQLDTGVKGNSKAAVKPSITDDEAIAIWERLIQSIRVRTPADSKIRDTKVNSVPLGSEISTGGKCPENGWWQCDETGVIASERRKRIAAGDVMPYAIIPGEQSLWQKLKGEQPRYRTPTVWKLVKYEETEDSPTNDHA